MTKALTRKADPVKKNSASGTRIAAPASGSAKIRGPKSWTSVPAYDVSLFLDGLEAGNLLDAVGYPIAADVALVPLIAGLTDYGVIIADATTLSALIP